MASNGRAELTVKTAKRIIIGNMGPQGSLDNDGAARVVLQYRNTPIQNIGLSPAQLLLHRRLHDFVPSHPILYKPHAEWIAAPRNREKSLSQHNAQLIEKYNRTAHTLRPLLKGQIESIQCTNNGQWSTTVQIIETLPHNQYRIRVDGSGRITLRNRRFLRKLETPMTPHPILSPSNGTPILEGNSESKAPALQTTDSETAPQPPLPMSSTNQPAVTTQTRPTQALSRLLPHNKPGLKELIPPERPLPMRGGGDIKHQ